MFESFIGYVYVDGLLADSVDKTLSIVVQEMRWSVKCAISERAENDVRIADALTLRRRLR